MAERINRYRCSHCGCDEPIYNAIDGKLYCDNCGMSLESTLPSHAQASKLEGGLTMTLDEWISRFDNEEADKLTQAEQLEIKLMLIELRERRAAAARDLEWLANQIKEG